MKKLFYVSTLLWIFFEVANVYFIMPMPGSQEINSIDVAYFLYSARWYFRIILLALISLSFIKSFSNPRKWLRITFLIFGFVVAYAFNFVMVADKMFLQPGELILVNAQENKIPLDHQIIGITYQNKAKAYPLEFLAYHHQIIDSIDNKKFMITYCSVCRTGRVFEPLVDNQFERFRLVGMDHFNAMFEDKSTGSWWRQVNGECIAGENKGKYLPEYFSQQMTLDNWLKLYPNSDIMQPDPASIDKYDPEVNFEKGTSTGSLTGTNQESWQKKSWVIGIVIGDSSKAYDWNKLEKERIIHDHFNNKNLAIVLDKDNFSFSAFELEKDQFLTWQNDSLFDGQTAYSFFGVSNSDKKLNKIQAYQEFWHSWLTFHPATIKDK